jgi:heterodisulfide reductase subunit D
MEFNLKKIQETNALACLECGKCTGVCPVSRHSRSFSPRLLLIKSVRNTHPDALKGADLWSCLTCQQCDTVCPSNIKYVEFIQMVRQFMGVENREGTCSHGGILDSILKIMTSPNLKQQRLDWLTKDYQTSNSGDYLYFVGCLPYYEVLFSDLEVRPLNIARSMIKILNYFDIKPQLMPNEKCCGHDFYWNGDLKNFRNLAEQNIEQIKQTGAKHVITACPECYRTLKVEYSGLFGKLDFDVQHISEFLAKRLPETSLSLKGDPLTACFQDPCRLGRHMGIYDEPRHALSHWKALSLTEMAHHHKRAICCGVSSWMNCSQVSKQIQARRLREAQATGSDIMVTSCPKCQIHFQCALLDQNLKEEVTFKIKDLTEVVAENLN